MIFNRPRDSWLTKRLKAKQERDAQFVWAAYCNAGLADLCPKKLAIAVVRKAGGDAHMKMDIPPDLLVFTQEMVKASNLFCPKPKHHKSTAHRIRTMQEIDRLWAMAENPEAAIKAMINILAELITPLVKQMHCPQQTDHHAITFEVTVLDMLHQPIALCEEIIKKIDTAVSDPPYRDFGFFAPLAGQLEANQRRIARLGVAEDWGRKQRPNLSDHRLGSEAERITNFLYRTPFIDYLHSKTQLRIGTKQRLEHMMLLAPTGWGKTQTLEYLIERDLEAATQGKRSLIVMESEGDLIRRIARHPIFTQRNAPPLYYIEPGKPGYMPTFSFFDLGGKAAIEMTATEREQMSNTAVDLYRYIFRALRGSELTEKQGYVFVQLVNLLSNVAGATFDTLLECLDDTETALRYAHDAPPRLNMFFRKKYTTTAFRQTRDQIFTRLDTFRSSAETFVKMVSGQRNNFDLLAAMNQGSVIVINSSKEFLGEETSAVFGRYIIALLRQSSFARSSKDIPCFVYLDEAQEYLDEKSGTLFQQARKRNIGLTIAHQGLQQMRPELRSTIAINTAIKLSGNSNYDDRQVMARNMGTSAGFLSGLQKHGAVRPILTRL